VNASLLLYTAGLLEQLDVSAAASERSGRAGARDRDAALALAWPFGPAGIALGVSIGCLGHAAAVAFGLRRFGLWSPDRALAARVMRIAVAVAAMGLALAATMRVLPQIGTLSLAALCLAGLAVYGLAAVATGALTRNDWAALTKQS